MNQKLMDKIKTMCGRRRLAHFGKESWNAADERELICLIKEAEKKFEANNWQDWDSILIKDGYNANFEIHKNDLQNGCEPITSSPSSVESTALTALKGAWKTWSIPPCLICNADYYVKGVNIRDVL